MAKLLFIKSERAKRVRIKRGWQIACLLLLAAIVIENVYLIYFLW